MTSPLDSIQIFAAERGDEKAFIGRMVFGPIPADKIEEDIVAIGDWTRKTFPEKFQYAQAVKMTRDDDVLKGVMVTFAPFSDETAAKVWMDIASEIVETGEYPIR